MARRFVHALTHWLPGVGVAVVGCALTYGLVQQQHKANAGVAQLHFVDEVRASADAVAQRMVAYTEVVNGVRDLFSVNPYLAHSQFEQVVAARQVSQRYPEIKNLSFTRWVPQADLPAMELRLRSQASKRGGVGPGPLVHPTLAREDHYVVEFLWPHEGNQFIWGLDIASQPSNLASMLSSRASGQASVSPPFELLQEQQQRVGFLLRVPVVVEGSGVGAPTRQFIGAVAASVRVSAMLDALAAQGYFRGLYVRLEDVGPAQSDEGQEATAVQAAALLGEWGEVQAPAQLDGLAPQVRVLQVHDRRWRLEFVPTRSMLSDVERQLPWWIGSVGAALTLLLALLVTLLMRQRAQALSEAQQSLQELKRSEQRFRAIFNQAAVGMLLSDSSSGQWVRVNQRSCDILGYTPPQLLGLSMSELAPTPPDPACQRARERLQAGEITEFHLETSLQRSDGSLVWVDLAVSTLHYDGSEQPYHVSVIQDITERRAMQQALHTSEQRLRAMLDNLPVGVLLVQEGQRMVYRNRSFVRITGYTEAQMVQTEQWWQRAYPDPAQREHVQLQWDELLNKASNEGGAIAPAEYEICCADGQRRLVCISGMLQGEDHLVVVEDLTERKAAEAEIQYLAYYDSLTRLPNRRLLLDRMHQVLAACERRKRCGALLLLDIDHFKTLNETYGHEAGDQLLRQVAERLQAATHEDHTVARYGDDEFVVVLEDLAEGAQEAAAPTEEAGQHLLEVLRAPFQLKGQTYHCSVSIGATIFCDLADSVDELLKRADLAMNQAKAAGRDTLRFYDPQMQATVNARAELELDMRQGMRQGQFTLFYQAQTDGKRIIGCEALLRWRHPQRGFVSPADFIPLAEETGLILPLGQWVIQTACEQIAAWADHPELEHLTLAVNVSPRQFQQEDFVAQVLALLHSSGANPRRLKLELTEGMLLQGVEDTIAKMTELKSHGVGFSLDDFGTGYSSLAYLKRLPLDQLKIDQGFVRDVLTDPNDAAIARTIVALGTTLGLHVIAEGVETQAQRAFLMDNHCHAWQGYLLSRPLPCAEFEALVFQYAGSAKI